MKCQICNLTVAPNDPEKQVVAGKPVHGNCFKRQVAKAAGAKRQEIIFLPSGEYPE